MVKERLLLNRDKPMPLYPNQHLKPTEDNKWDLGSSTREWRNAWIDGKLHADTIEGFTLSGNITPERDDAFDLGSASAELRNAWFDGTVHADVLIADEDARIRVNPPLTSGVGSIYITGKTLYVYTAAHTWASTVLG